MNPLHVSLIIPALNEEQSLPKVLGDIPTLVDEVIVVDNGCTDSTPELAASLGARVVKEARRGYGSACLAGISALSAQTDIVAFIDADWSDHPEELSDVLKPILDERADFVVGSRVLGRRERGALLPQARFGNWLATRLIRWLFGQRYTDLGPMRAIRYDALKKLRMRDTTFGWTVEMQVRAVQHKLRIEEVPASYRRRIGKSKITGTLKGTVLAGWKILTTIFVLRMGFRR